MSSVDALPYGLYDTHAHFYTDDVERFPLADIGNTISSADEVRERVIATPTRLDRMLAWWDEAGVQFGCAVQYRSAYGFDNRYLLDCVAQAPDRLSGVVSIDTSTPDAPERLAAWAEAGLASAVRLAGVATEQGDLPWLRSDGARRVWAVADRLGLAVVIIYLPPTLAGEPAQRALGQVRELANEYPNAKVVIDHLAWPHLKAVPPHGLTEGHLALRDCPNVLMKFTTNNVERLTAEGRSPAAFLRNAVDIFGAERMMWGTDAGHCAGPYSALVHEGVQATALLNDAERRQVLRETGLRTFGARTPAA